MNLKLTNTELREIKDAALWTFKNVTNPSIEPEYWATACILQATIEFLQRKGIPVAVELPTKAYDGSIEDL